MITNSAIKPSRRVERFQAFSALCVGLFALGGCARSTAPGASGAGDDSTTGCADPAPTFVVSAHRGGAAYAPENTLAAFENALRLGVDELEMDTQLSADGELVVIHDDTLDRTTDCSGAVNSKTLAEIRACDAAYWFSPGQSTTSPSEDRAHPLRSRGIRVPTLREVLDWHATLGCRAPSLSIEIKNIPYETNFDPAGAQVAQVLLPLLAEYGVEARTVVQSFWPVTLTQVKLMNPALRTQVLTTSSIGTTAAANLAVTVSGGHDISAPNFDAPDFRAPLIQAAHAAGKRVLPYTVDTYADQQLVHGLGTDGLITNYPACALRLLGRAAPARSASAWLADDIEACPDVAAPPQPSLADRPDEATCAALRPARWQPASGHEESNARLRAFAIQYKQEIRHVESYASFRTKMRCLMQDHVVPHLRPGVPALVVFNEDIGLMTIATGARGAVVRAQAQTPLRGPLGDGVPAGILTGLGLLNATYATQVLAYQSLFPGIDPRKQVFVAATDTFVRAYMQTFSDIARDYGVYVVASNNMPRYRASRAAADIALFGDPEVQADEVYIASSARVTNTTHLWGPRDLHPEAPRGATNLLFANDKVPLTDIEQTLIGLDEGPATGDAARSNAAGYEVEGFRLGFATSLPAFQWGYDFGQRPANLEPCADVRAHYMPCMDALGVNVVIQAEANPGRWAQNYAGGWQPLEWMNSTWRTVGEPSVGFLYNVTAHLVGNLLDLAFDGQTAITARHARATPAHYVGNLEFIDGTDLEAYRPFLGDKAEFIGLAPWVTPDASRAELIATGAALSPGSGDALENDYLETAVWADLTR